jgi:DNA-binding CsgD family transcriptional regulator
MAADQHLTAAPTELARQSSHPTGPGTIIGRGRELGLISDLVEGISQRGGALVVRGPAGIGKSTLVAAAAAQASSRGVRVLTAAGVQSEAQLPFAALHQIVRPVLDRVDRLPPGQARSLRAAFGMTDGPAPEPFLIGLGALELLADVAADSGLLLIVEDAHWVDRPTAEALSFVARRLEAEPVLLLIALRDGYDTPLGRLGLPELLVGALQPVDAARLLEVLAPGLETPLRERVLAAAAGTPLALVELPAALSSEPADSPRPPGEWVISDRLERAYAARVRDLPEDTRALVLLMATDDGDDLSEVLAAAPALLDGRAASVDSLQAAVAAGVVELRGGRVGFRHPLMRSAVYQAARAADRRRAHAALAAVLLEQLDRRAWHLAASAAQPSERVAAEVEQMASRAEARGGTLAALAALQRAAELTPARERRGQRQVRAAALALKVGEPVRARQLLDAAEVWVTDPFGRARLDLLRHAIDPGRPGDPATVMFLVDTGEQVARAGDLDLALEFLLAAAMQSWWADPGEQARRRVTASVERLPLGADDPRVLSILGFTDPQGHGGLVIDGAGRLLPHQLDPESAHLLGATLNVAGAFDLSAAFLSRAVSGLREQGRLGLLPAVLTQQAWTAINRLDWGIAVPAADEAVRLGRETDQGLWVAAARTGQAMLAGLRGEDRAAETLIRQAETVVLPLGASAVLAGVQLTRGVTALASGRYAEAFEQLLRLFDPADPSYHRLQSTWAVGDLAEAALHSGEVETARAVVTRLESAGRMSPNPWLRVGLLFARPLLAEADRAEALFREGLSADLSRWPLYRARLLGEYGGWLRRQRRVAESRAPLRAARDAFDALGVLGWGERARQELRASGEVSEPHQSEAWSRLSPQELQISQMAAQGLTNREIGMRLYLSHRTVGSHLYRIYPKLGITSRAQLRLIVGEPGPGS